MCALVFPRVVYVPFAQGSGATSRTLSFEDRVAAHGHETNPWSSVPMIPASAKVEFSLVSGVANGVESGVSDSSGVDRPHTNPCP